MKWNTVLVMALLMWTMPTLAAQVKFDDGQFEQGGVIAYDGGDGPLVGSNINMNLARGVQTQLNDGADAQCIRCLMDFQTGAKAGNAWLPGGFLRLTGTLFYNNDEIASGVLLEGRFTRPSLVLLGSGSGLSVGIGAGVVSGELAAFFGLDSFVRFATTSLSISGCNGDRGIGFTCQLDNSDLNVSTAVPVPAAAWLFASALLGLVMWRKVHA